MHDRVLAPSMIWLAFAGALLAVSGAFVAALLRVRGIVAFGLAVAVLAFAEIVVVSYALSVLDAYERRWFMVALAAVAIIAAAAVSLVRPPWPSLAHRAVVRQLASDRLVVVLAVVVLAGLVYVVALALFTPPTERDALSYHLVRALFWVQDGAVGRVPGPVDPRLNEFPVNAELLQGASMLLSSSGRWVALPQLASLLVAMLAIFGIARRVGFDPTAAAFGALLFATLPTVALQAPTALNDLVVAALVVVTAYFALGRTASDAVLGSVTVALLVGTKGTALFALPILLALAIVAQRGGQRVLVLAGGLAGAVLGAGWYVGNVADGTGPFGSFAPRLGGIGDGPMAYLARTSRYVVETIELPGAVGDDRFLFVAAAAVVAACAFRARRPATVLTGAAVTLLALVVLPLEGLLHRAYWKGWDAVGYEEATVLGVSRDSTVASNALSWYGPVGLVATLGALILIAREATRGSRAMAMLVLALAPVAVLVEVAVAVTYMDLNGRFVMGGVALSAATWGIIHRTTRAVAIALVALASTTLLLGLVNYRERPAGVALLERTDRPSIWRLPRQWAQSIEPEFAVVIGYVDDHVPDGESVAVARTASYPFAYVGYPALERRVVYADTPSEAAAERAGWAVLPSNTGCEAGWRVVFRSPPLAVYRQVPGASCR